MTWQHLFQQRGSCGLRTIINFITIFFHLAVTQVEEFCRAVAGSNVPGRGKTPCLFTAAQRVGAVSRGSGLAEYWLQGTGSRPSLYGRMLTVGFPAATGRPAPLGQGLLEQTNHVDPAASSYPSSSSTIRSTTPRPIAQNPGSVASSPNGASSSLWCFVPPARSISR